VCIVYAYLACGIKTNQNQAVRVLSTTARKQSAHRTTLHCILPSTSLQTSSALGFLQLQKIIQGDPMDKILGSVLCVSGEDTGVTACLQPVLDSQQLGRGRALVMTCSMQGL